MKKILLFSMFLMLVFAIGCGEQYPEKFSFLPENPQAGQEITVKYKAAGTNLAKAQDVSMLAYQFFGPEMPTVEEIILKKKGKGWVGSFTPADSALVVFVNFVEGKKVDNNDQAGYEILMKDAEGNIIPGAKGALGYCYYSGAYPVSIKRDLPKAFETLKQEFDINPDQKENYQSVYFDVVMRNDRANGKDLVKADLDVIEAMEEKTIDQKRLLASWYTRVGEQEKGDKYYQEVLKAEPNGEFAEMDQFKKFRAMTKLDDKVKFYKTFKVKFPEARYMSYVTSVILKGFTDEKRYDEAEDFLNNEAVGAEATHYNSIAWDMVEKGINIKTAAVMAGKGVELGRKALEAPVSEKPSYLTEKEWREQLKSPLSMILDTYGFALYKLGQAKEAVAPLKEAAEIVEMGDKDLNEHYASALVDAGNDEEALKELTAIIKAGYGTEMINESFKKVYAKVKGSDDGAEEELARFNSAGFKKVKEELAKEMIEKPAPDFTLEDLDGNTVSLADLKGKAVVVDFWATWCGPCKRSFPGMQKAVDKFKDDEKVAFIFVNTWERGENIKENVAKFIKDNNYTFHVLMDLENKVVADFGVEGIPTKFILGADGNIRFKSVGFGGDDQKLVDELSLMIEMVK